MLTIRLAKYMLSFGIQQILNSFILMPYNVTRNQN